MRGLIKVLVLVVVGVALVGCTGDNSEQVAQLEASLEKLQIQVDQLQTENASLQAQTELMASSAEVDQLREILEGVEGRLPREIGESGTFATGIDPWEVYLAQMTASEIALERGDEQTARTMALVALGGLGPFCNARFLPGYAISPEIQTLVADYFRMSPDPEVFTAYGDETLRVYGNWGC